MPCRSTGPQVAPIGFALKGMTLGGWLVERQRAPSFFLAATTARRDLGQVCLQLEQLRNVFIKLLRLLH